MSHGIPTGNGRAGAPAAGTIRSEPIIPINLSGDRCLSVHFNLAESVLQIVRRIVIAPRITRAPKDLDALKTRNILTRQECFK